MGIISNYEDIEDGRNLREWNASADRLLIEMAAKVNWKDTVNPLVAHCQLLIDKMTALKIEIPTASIEIDVFITDLQSRLNTFKTVNGL